MMNSNVVRLRDKAGRPMVYDGRVMLPPPMSLAEMQKRIKPPLWKTALTWGLVMILSSFVGLLLGALTGCGGTTIAERASMTMAGGNCQTQGDGVIAAARTCEEAVDGINRLVDNSPECRASYRKRDTKKTCADVGVQPGGVK